MGRPSIEGAFQLLVQSEGDPSDLEAKRPSEEEEEEMAATFGLERKEAKDAGI